MSKPLIISDKNSRSLKLKKQIIKILNKEIIKKPNITIVIGGDGFMLKTLKKNKNSNKSFYGINSGNYGFLMNKFSKKNILRNLKKSKMVKISPLEMSVKGKNRTKKSLAINEVSILRQSRQACLLCLKIDTSLIAKLFFVLFFPFTLISSGEILTIFDFFKFLKIFFFENLFIKNP